MHISTVLPSSAISSMRPSTVRGRLGVEAGGRLVEEQEVGIVQHRAGEREPGAHAGRVAADPMCERVGDAEAVGGLRDPRVDVGAVDLEERRGVARGCRCR